MLGTLLFTEKDEYQPVMGKDGDEVGEEENSGESDETESELEKEQKSRHALWTTTNLYVLFCFRLIYSILLSCNIK